MENETLKVSETLNQPINQQLKLIDGRFTKSEALNIINNVLDVKINFHKLQRLSKTEGNINDTCLYDNSRLNQLMKDKSAIKDYLNSLEIHGCNIKISSVINIEIDK